MTSGLADPTPLMEDIGRALGNITEDAFQRERSPFGDSWERLTERYVRTKRKGNAHPILQRSGGLAGGITHGGDRRSAHVAAHKKYAAIHQFGGTPGMAPGPAAIPARSYLPVSAAGSLAPVVVEEVEDLIAEWLRSM